MSQQPKTVTDRLANVIQVIQLGHKSGKLIAERDDGPVFEQGTLTFVHGRIVQASAGQREGQDALNWLSGWHTCRFSFAPTVPTSASGATGALPSVQFQKQQTGTTPRIAASRLSETNPAMRAQPPFARSQTPPPEHGTTGYEAARETPRLHTSATWLATPYRTRQLDEGIRLIERMGLSRTHRRLFLLVDGRRTTAELVRLMGHEAEEVARLLQDLERAGVIQP